MLVQFQPSGDIKDTTKVTPSKGYSGGPYAPLEIGAGLGTTSTIYGGRIVSGSELFGTASAGRSFLLWKTPSNGTVASWKMDDEAAIQTGIETIATALDGDEAFIILKSDGTLGS